ncbi:unnamed protein product [Linum tenue]|uniref:Uncharacterized protein n=1 Tax=Linum tenue TaxID=586396 RepID=A0AAV0KB39_9ROSI|nr:unnamed protein product [Linum tenue]
MLGRREWLVTGRF